MNHVSTHQQVDISYVVKDPGGRVIVIFSGADAPYAASEWAGRGYDVVPTPLDTAAAAG
jgi:hypothetical protein